MAPAPGTRAWEKDDAEAFLRLEIPARLWLAEGLITERGLAMARRGAEVSHFLLGLSCSIASGRPFLRYQVPAACHLAGQGARQGLVLGFGRSEPKEIQDGARRLRRVIEQMSPC